MSLAANKCAFYGWLHPKLHPNKQVLCDLQLGVSLGNPPDGYKPLQANLQLEAPPT